MMRSQQIMSNIINLKEEIVPLYLDAIELASSKNTAHMAKLQIGLFVDYLGSKLGTYELDINNSQQVLTLQKSVDGYNSYLMVARKCKLSSIKVILAYVNKFIAYTREITGIKLMSIKTMHSRWHSKSANTRSVTTVLSKSQVELLLKELKPATHLIRTKQYSLHLLVNLMINTGMRVGELLYLKQNKYSSQQILKLGSPINYIELPQSACKGNKGRFIPASNQVIEYMDSWLNESTLLLSYSTYYGSFKKTTLALFGNDSITLHTLRHTFANNLKMQGVDHWLIANILGHKDPKTTYAFYFNPLGGDAGILGADLLSVIGQVEVGD